MDNKGINPLYVSALDVLIGTLGVFIVLNFLHSRIQNPPPTPQNPPIALKADKPGAKPTATTALNKPVNGNNGSWWRRTFGSAEKSPPTSPSASNPSAPPPKPVEAERPLPSPPQDPVAVDLMKQTQGAVVILLQQSDVAKSTVEMMLQQGSRSWKPSRASKYQDATFAYQKGLNYYFQKDIQPGTYDVLVRIRRGGKSAVQQPFALFGKIVPPGGRSQTYAFGRYGLGGGQDEWTVAGHLIIGANGL
ncbi:MAG: hypothetical protein ABIO24_14185, partial [Saprospiraceae bacterium]